MLPKPLLYAVVSVVTVVWAYAVWVDSRSETFDAGGVHLIFGSIVGGVIGLARRDSKGNGGDPS